jgi:hypothetical protein
LRFERVTNLTAPDGHNVPGMMWVPDSPRGGALLLPPYGATKEQMLGLAVALAEQQFAALAMEVCGHGQNMAPIGPGMRDEVEAGLAYVRRFGQTAAVGVSLGGRLALMSSADYIVALSPSVVVEISPQGKWMFENFPSPAVREPYSGYVVELLEKLGPVAGHDRPCLLAYAERDIPAILQGAAGLKASLRNAELYYITRELRPEVQHENAFVRYLPRWFNHVELKFNSEVYEIAARWLAERWAKVTAA